MIILPELSFYKSLRILLSFIAVYLILGTGTASVVYASPDITQNKEDTSTISQDKTIQFGVYTSDKPTEMYRKFQPVIDYLQGELRRQGLLWNIKLRIYPSYAAGLDALVKGECDFVRFGPASYILAKNRNKDIRLLAMEHEGGRKLFSGVFVVNKDSHIQSISELKGKTFAFGDKNSTIGRYLSQAELVKAGIHSSDLKNFKYLGRHDKVALAVAAGNYDAGVVKESTYKKYGQKLKKIGQFPNITKPWVARAGLGNELFKGLQKALLGLKDKKVLGYLKKDGFLPCSDNDYLFVRKGMFDARRF